MRVAVVGPNSISKPAVPLRRKEKIARPPRLGTSRFQASRCPMSGRKAPPSVFAGLTMPDFWRPPHVMTVGGALCPDACPKAEMRPSPYGKGSFFCSCRSIRSTLSRGAAPGCLRRVNVCLPVRDRRTESSERWPRRGTRTHENDPFFLCLFVPLRGQGLVAAPPLGDAICLKPSLCARFPRFQTRT